MNKCNEAPEQLTPPVCASHSSTVCIPSSGLQDEDTPTSSKCCWTTGRKSTVLTRWRKTSTHMWMFRLDLLTLKPQERILKWKRRFGPPPECNRAAVLVSLKESKWHNENYIRIIVPSGMNTNWYSSAFIHFFILTAGQSVLLCLCTSALWCARRQIYTPLL